MIKLDIPDVGPVEFPESMTDAEIQAAIRDDILPQAKAQRAEEAKKPKEAKADDYWSRTSVDGDDGGDGRPGYLSQFVGDVSRGGSQLKQLGYGLGAMAADVVGADETAQNWLNRYIDIGQDIQETNAPTIGTFRNIHGVDDAVRYGIEAVGENAAMFLPSLVTGGIGAIAARKLAQKGLAEVVESQVAKGVARDVAEREALGQVAKAGMVGGAAGTIPANVGMEMGSIYGDVYEKTGEKAPGTAAALGAVAGALDSIGDAMGLKRVFGRELAETATRSLFSRLGVEGAKQFLVETPTEMLQTILERTAVALRDPSQAVFSQQGIDEIIDAGAKGGLGGVGIGVTTEAAGSIGDWAKSRGVAPTQENLQNAAAAGDVEAQKILAAAGMSAEQLAALSPGKATEFAERIAARREAEGQREPPEARVPNAPPPPPVEPAITPGMKPAERRDAVLKAREATEKRMTRWRDEQRAGNSQQQMDAEIERRRLEEEGVASGEIDPGAVSRRVRPGLPDVINLGEMRLDDRLATGNTPAPGLAEAVDERIDEEVLKQKRTEQAFKLARYRAKKAGEGIRDVQAGGRPEGGVESQKPVLLHQGMPVEVVGRRTESNGDGEDVLKLKVRRYDPRAGDPNVDPKILETFELDPETGKPIEYEVEARELSQGRYAVGTRRAQQFEEKENALKANVGTYKSAITGETVKPDAAGQRIDEVQDLKRQTYRTTAPDPTVPGAEGPTTGVDPRQFPPDPDGDNQPRMQPSGPVLRSNRPEQGEGARYDLGSGNRGPEMRTDQTQAEAEATAQAERRRRMWEQSQEDRRQDDTTGEDTDWGRAKKEYEPQKDIYSATFAGVDADGWPLTDKNGFILSTKGGPIRFETQSAMVTRLKELRKKFPDANIVNANHPGPKRKAKVGEEAYFTLHALNPKPAPKEAQAEQEQAAPDTEAPAPEQPVEEGAPPGLPAPAAQPAVESAPVELPPIPPEVQAAASREKLAGKSAEQPAPADTGPTNDEIMTAAEGDYNKLNAVTQAVSGKTGINNLTPDERGQVLNTLKPKPKPKEQAEDPFLQTLARAENGDKAALAELTAKAKEDVRGAIRAYGERGDAIEDFNLGGSIDRGGFNSGMSGAKSGQVVAKYGSKVKITFPLREVWTPKATPETPQADTETAPEAPQADTETASEPETTPEPKPAFEERRIRDGSGKEPGRRGAERATPFTVPEEQAAPEPEPEPPSESESEFKERRIREGSGKEPSRRGAERGEPFTAPEEQTEEAPEPEPEAEPDLPAKGTTRENAIAQAKLGTMPDAATIKALSNDGKVAIGDAKAFLREMGLNATKETDDALARAGVPDKSEGGAWIYDLKKVIQSGQNLLGVGEGVRGIDIEGRLYTVNEHNQIRTGNRQWVPNIIGTKPGDTYLNFNSSSRDGNYGFLPSRGQPDIGVRFNEGTWDATITEQDGRQRKETGSYKPGDPQSIAETLDKLSQTKPLPRERITPSAPAAETKPPAVKAERTVAGGVKQARSAVEAGKATWLEGSIASLHDSIERRKANKEKLAQKARDAKTAYENGPADRKASDATPRYKDNDRFDRRSEWDRTASDRDVNLKEIRDGEEKLKALVAQLPPKSKKRLPLLGRLFGRNEQVELTAEEEAADEAAWKERLETLAPRAETVADVRRILDENVELGILNKATADGISSLLDRIPTQGLKGLRLVIQDRMTAQEREVLGTDKRALGEYLTFDEDPDLRVLVVQGKTGSQDAVRVFAHENAHILFNMVAEPDMAEARRIYDRLPISRQALHTLSYDKDERFEEWFAESMADHYTSGVTTPGGTRTSLTDALGKLLDRVYKRIVDLFSGEKAQMAAFFDGLEASLGRSIPDPASGITRRQARPVNPIAVLANPINMLTGDWRAWRNGAQNLARDAVDVWSNKGRRPNRQSYLGNAARWWFFSADGEYRSAIGRFKSPTLNLLADTFHAKAGTTQGIDPKLATKLGMKLTGNATFNEAVGRKVAIEYQNLSRILDPYREDAGAIERIVDMVQNPATRRGGGEAAAASQLAKQLADLHTYMTDAGVDVGKIKNGYFPREVDVAAVMRDPTRFVDLAAKEYRVSGLNSKEAKEAADSWLTNILYGGSGSPMRDGGGNTPSFVQSRVLSKSADVTLKDFYQRDPDFILGSYINRAVKRAEIARRFGDGWKNWEAIEQQIRKEDPAAAGMLDHLRDYAAIATGVQHHGVSHLVRSGSSMLRSFTTLSLLEKSTLSSLAEAITPAIRTGNLKDLIPAVTRTLREITREIRDLPPSVAAELAADIGAIAGSGINSIMAARFAGGDPLGRAQARILASYFRRIGLEQWTNATLISSTERGAVFLRRLARDVAGSGLNPKASRFYLGELGIPEDQVNDFVRFVNSFGDNLPTAAELDKGGAMGAAYRTGLLRFVDQTIMRPSSTTRPRWASHPVGAIAFQLQAFSYAFSKNVLLRSLRLGKKAMTESDLSLFDRTMLLAPLLMLPVLVAVQSYVGDLRDYLFMDPARRKAQTPATRLEKAISRAGLTGALDPYLQMLTNSRYQRDPVSTLVGPFMGVFGAGLEAGIQSVVNNTPSTNAAERKVAEAVYDVLLEPSWNILLGYAPGGLLTSSLTTGVIPAMRDNFVDTFAGKRKGHKQQKVFGLYDLMQGKQFAKAS